MTTHWKWIPTERTDRADIGILKAIEEKAGIPAEDIPHLTRSQLKRLMETDCVTANGVPIKSSSKLKIGQTIEIHFPEPEPTELIPEDRPIDVLFEDEHLLVLNKPQGLTVHPSSTQTKNTLVHALLHQVKDLSGVGGVLRPGIVHRIDKNTSGAMVVTKNDFAHTRMAKIFAEHDIERSYWALCYGSSEKVSSHSLYKIESLIGRDPVHRKKMSMKVTSGKKAITYVKKIKEFSTQKKKVKAFFGSWFELTLETGRTHQIRVHLAGLGNSIFGDPEYGTPKEGNAKWQLLPESVKEVVLTLPGQALHARTLGFKHPVSEKFLRFEAPPPEAFTRLLEALSLASIS